VPYVVVKQFLSNFMQYIYCFLKIIYYICIVENIKIKIARVENQMSQQDLADAVGATRQTIGLIEKGKYNPSLKLCISIAKVLGKTLDELFWEQKTKP